MVTSAHRTFTVVAQRAQILALGLFLLSQNTFADIVQNYNFPYSRMTVATITAAIAKPAVMPDEPYIFPVPKPERSNVPISGGQNHPQFTARLQSGRAPLAFIIPGIGAMAGEGLATALAEKVYGMGFHAVTVNNPFSWMFSLALSRTGIVGYAPEDARDLYEHMKSVQQQLQNDGVHISSTSLVGFSLGALYAIHVKDIDRHERFFNFETTVMMNPPVQFLPAVQTVDSLFEISKQKGWSADDLFNLRTQAQRLVMGLLYRPVDDNYYMGLEEMVPFDDTQIQWLIGDAFRKSVTDIILISQRVHDLGILKTPETPLERNARAGEAARYSLMAYTEKFVVPFFAQQTGKSAAEMIAESELKHFEHLLATDSSIYIMHNENDFLLQPGDVSWLNKTLGQRALIYPTGGHVGNWWYKDNVNHLRQILTGAALYSGEL